VLCASFRPLSGWLVPLSLAALLGGLGGLVRARKTARFRLTFPVAGSTVAGIVLFVGLVCPGLLGPTYQATGARHADPQRQAIFRMVLPAGVPGTGPDDPVWADAGRFALCQEHVTVQVIEVTAAKPSGLVVRLRIMGEDSKAPLREENRPTLTDAAGKVCNLLDVQTASAPLNQGAKAAVRVAAMDVVYSFAVEGSLAPPFRLEVPAAACGGTGAFRFALPGTLIKRP
jgi:hypothetical protein